MAGPLIILFPLTCLHGSYCKTQHLLSKRKVDVIIQTLSPAVLFHWCLEKDQVGYNIKGGYNVFNIKEEAANMVWTAQVHTYHQCKVTDLYRDPRLEAI